MTISEKVSLYAWGLKELSRRGRPEITLGFLGGIGDDLLCTAAIEELLHAGVNRIWFVSRFPTLYRFVDQRVQVVPAQPRFLRLADRLRRPMRSLSYSQFDEATDRDSAPSMHLIAVMCQKAGLTGEISLRPHLPLFPDELARAGEFRGCVAIQNSVLAARLPMGNKQWDPAGFQAVSNFLIREGFTVVQIGDVTDPPLQGARDLRGRLQLRETAVVLQSARLFVGMVGFVMHLARAVDCPAVIVYGGRELPDVTGYSCNRNIVNRPPCSPCWQRNRCDFQRACLTGISVESVTSAVAEELSSGRRSLSVEVVNL